MIDKIITDVVAESYNGRITKVSKNLQQNNSETVTNENGKEIPNEWYMPLEERKKVVDNLDFNIVV